MITIINVAQAKLDQPYIYVGRTPRFGGPSVLHNRWSHQPQANAVRVPTVHDAVQSFRSFLWDCLKDTWHNKCEAKTVREEFARLVELARAGDIVLACHCHPNPCHAHTVKRAIEWRLSL